MSNTENQARFIVIEGADGSGKTTTAEAVVNLIKAEGKKAILVREPGETGFGEAIRKIVLDKTIKASDLVLMYAFFAARAQLYEEVVAPALLEGVNVICDRGVLSTIVYQGLFRDKTAPDADRYLISDAIKSANQTLSRIARPFVTCVLLPTVEEYERRDALRVISDDRFEGSKEKLAYTRELYQTCFSKASNLNHHIEYRFGSIGMVHRIVAHQQTPVLLAWLIANTFVAGMSNQPF